jgi:hypothetical protein
MNLPALFADVEGITRRQGKFLARVGSPSQDIPEKKFEPMTHQHVAGSEVATVSGVENAGTAG